MNPSIMDFADWFRSQSGRLLTMSSEAVADELVTKIAAIDDRLGVEVERQGGSGPRDLVLTAFSDPSAFPTVRAIVASLGEFAGWSILALKQPRGFEFTISVGGTKVRADSLRFRSISDIRNGFELLVPGAAVSGSETEEMAWLIVETGIGEEMAGVISHLEFGDSSDMAHSRPIGELAATLRSARPSP